MPECCTSDNLEYLGVGLTGADYYRCTVCYRIIKQQIIKVSETLFTINNGKLVNLENATKCDICKLKPDTFDTECAKCEVIK